MKPIARTLACLACALIAPSIRAQAHGQIIVIANPTLRAVTASKSEIREVFTGATSTLKGGSRVTPVLLKSSSVTDEFLAQYLDEADATFRTRWRTLVFSGQSTMPRSVDTEAAVVTYVAHNPGAIGYITRTTPHEGVKVLVQR